MTNSFFYRLACRPAALLGMLVLLAMALGAILAPWLYPGDPMSMVGGVLLRPGEDPTFPFGTDQMGRDLAAEVFHGARITLLVGIVSAFAATGFGVLVGAIAGFYGDMVDGVLMRLTELFQTIPGFLLAIVFIVILGSSIGVIVFSIAAISWPAIARMVRAEFLSLKSRDFVQSSRVIGMSDARIILTQMLPNCMAPIVVTSSITVATAILTEAGLSFLGLGDPNLVSWGSVIGVGRESLRTSAYLTLIPGLAILLTVLAINLLGEGLNDAMNTRLRVA